MRSETWTVAVLRAKSDQVWMVEEDMVSSNIKTNIHINVFILGCKWCAISCTPTNVKLYYFTSLHFGIIQRTAFRSKGMR